MTSFKTKYLVLDKDRHGNIRYYVKKSGQKKIRIRKTPESKEFFEEYSRAINGIEQGQLAPYRLCKNSLGYLCNLYLASEEFSGLSASTRSWRRRELLSICERYAEWPYSLMNPLIWRAA